MFAKLRSMPEGEGIYWDICEGRMLPLNHLSSSSPWTSCSRARKTGLSENRRMYEGARIASHETTVKHHDAALGKHW